MGVERGTQANSAPSHQIPFWEVSPWQTQSMELAVPAGTIAMANACCRRELAWILTELIQLGSLGRVHTPPGTPASHVAVLGEFGAPGFHPAQFQLLWPFGK